MNEWNPSAQDIIEANEYWTVSEAIELGPITLAEQMVMQDPAFAEVFMECLERALAMYPGVRNVNDTVTKVA